VGSRGELPHLGCFRLLRDDSKVRTQFASLIAGAGIGGGRGSLAPSLYWQIFDAEGQAAINLGASYSKPVGDGFQDIREVNAHLVKFLNSVLA
jgi:hypothetical protein